MNTGLLTIAGVIVAAMLALFGVLIGHLYGRVGKLEGQVQDERDYNHKMWVWGRSMIDLYYRNRKAGAPEPWPIPSRGDDE